MTMRQRKYIKPKMKVRTLRIALLNDVSGPDMPFEAKRNSFSTDIDVQQGVEELDRMFE